MPYSYTLHENILTATNVSLAYDQPVLRDVNFSIQNIIRPGHTQGQISALLAPSGMGKCFAAGTKVLMFDGTTKAVEQVISGDMLMGPDSKPRKVLGTNQGIGELYRITPRKGTPHIVNGPHVLSLMVHGEKGKNKSVVNISVDDYLKTSKNFKNKAKLRRTGVCFDEKPVAIDPYMFGIWLGDGHSGSFAITNEDVEIVDHMFAYSKANGLGIRARSLNAYGLSSRHQREFSPTSALRRMGVLNNKHIPLSYRANSRAVRMSLLAGIIDSDGSLSCGCYDVVQKNKALADDIVYLARSLGLAAYAKECRKVCTNNGVEGIYHRICISGNISEIPVKVPHKKATPRVQIKDHLLTGFEVESVGVGAYYGFEVDQDHLFMLDDFTITHNSTLFRILSGISKPQSGEVLIGDRPVRPGDVGVVAQDFPLFSHLTVMENIMMAAKLKIKDAKARRETCEGYLASFGLADRAKVYPHQLSGGQRQRLSIIQQVVSCGHLLLMDEPFSGLDVLRKEEVQNLIQTIAAAHEHNSIVITTHDIAAALAIADTVEVLGRERGPDGVIIPGAKVLYRYNLMDMGITWRPDNQSLPIFGELEREIKARFHEIV